MTDLLLPSGFHCIQQDSSVWCWTGERGVSPSVGVLEGATDVAALGAAATTDALVDMDGLTADTRAAWEDLVVAVHDQLGLDLVARSARRTCAAQAEQYAIGRSGPDDARAPTTFAMGCRSWHVVGRAVDFFVYYPDGRKSGISSDYTAVGQFAEGLGWVWGGRFQGFGPNGDEGHVQWNNGHTTEELCPDPANCVDIEPSVPATSGRWGVALLGATVLVAAGVGGVLLARQGAGMKFPRLANPAAPGAGKRAKVVIGPFDRSGDPSNWSAPITVEGDAEHLTVHRGTIGYLGREVDGENVALRGGNSSYKYTVTGYRVVLWDSGDGEDEPVFKTRAEARAYVISTIERLQRGAR